MSNSMTKTVHSATYGLPPRPTTAANPLWQHLLTSKDRAPTSMANIAAIAPPTGPLDKNATSMRILLHDTQSNFEKFGKHVGQLFDEIKDCKLQMKSLHSRFERDRERLMGDFIDLINRSQKECQKSIGSPAQSQQIETLFKNVEHRLSGIDHKLDAVQSFNQTHTQALQTQIQAVQLLLDKQASIIATVSPLLPLLQALPLHIDTVKLSLNETLEKSITTFKENHRLYSPSRTRSTTTAGLAATVKRAEKRKWPGAEQSPSASSTTPTSESPLHKKSRKNETTSNLKSTVVLESTKEYNVTTSRPSVGRRDSSAAFRGVIAAQTLSRKNVNDNDVFSTVGVSPSNSTAPMSSRLGNHVGKSSIPKFATPRRPLTDLLPVPSSSSSRLGSSPGQQRNKNMLQRHATRERSLGRSNTLAAVFPSANLPVRGSAPTPGQLQPPSILHIHKSLAGSSNAPYANVDSLENLRTYAASTSGQGSYAYTPNLSGLPQSLSIKREIVDETSNTVALAPTIASVGFEFLSSKPKATFGRQKDRRSPIKDGRRFIPLVDSEDEELEGNII